MYFAAWALAGALLVTTSWFLSFAHIPRFQTYGGSFWVFLRSDWLRLLVFLLPFAAGFAISFWAERRLKRNFMDGVWTEVELAPALTFLEHPLRNLMGWILFGVSVIVVLAIGGHTSRVPEFTFLSSLFWFSFLHTMTATRLRQLLAPRKSSNLLNWQSFKPLQSEHWGEQPQR